MSGHATGGDYSLQSLWVQLSNFPQPRSRTSAIQRRRVNSGEANRELTRLPKHSPTRHSLNRENPDFVISPYFVSARLKGSHFHRLEGNQS